MMMVAGGGLGLCGALASPSSSGTALARCASSSRTRRRRTKSAQDTLQSDPLPHKIKKEKDQRKTKKKKNENAIFLVELVMTLALADGRDAQPPLAMMRMWLPAMSNLAGPIQHFRSAILFAWQGKVAADLCAGRGFRGELLLDSAPCISITLPVLGRDKALLWSVLVVGFGMGSF